MKKRILTYIAAASFAILCSCTEAMAQQNFRTGYFLDGYAYRYKFNPAFQGERGYFALPVIGRTGIGIESSLAMSDLIYPVSDGKLVTFLHPDVQASEFMRGISNVNKLAANIDMGILSTGFRSGKSYHTIDMSLRADVGINLPGSIFEFAKNGSSAGRTAYDINNLGAKLDSRFEIAYGYSRSISKNIYVGARIKFLLGGARASVLMDRMTVEMSENRWAVRGSGNLVTSGMLAFKTKAVAGTSDSPSSDNIIAFEPYLSMFEGPGETGNLLGNLSNFGAAADLGITWNFLRYFTLSASVLDLGFMSWSNTSRAYAPDEPWEFSGFGDNIGSEGSLSLGEQLEGMGKDLLNALSFERREAGLRSAESLAMTVHVGLEARMPFYERMSFGLLGTHRFDGLYSWTEGRVSLNLSPLKWLSITGNYAISDFGHSAGAAVSLHTKGFNLCIGTDSFLPFTNVTPQFVPIDNWNTNVILSMSFAFGKYCRAN